jgi:hypothetical protein
VAKFAEAMSQPNYPLFPDPASARNGLFLNGSRHHVLTSAFSIDECGRRLRGRTVSEIGTENDPWSTRPLSGLVLRSTFRLVRRRRVRREASRPTAFGRMKVRSGGTRIDVEVRAPFVEVSITVAMISVLSLYLVALGQSGLALVIVLLITGNLVFRLRKSRWESKALLWFIAETLDADEESGVIADAGI